MVDATELLGVPAESAPARARVFYPSDPSPLRRRSFAWRADRPRARLTQPVPSRTPRHPPRSDAELADRRDRGGAGGPLLPQPLLYLSAFFEKQRDEYYRRLLRVSLDGEWEEWVEFFLTGIREQARDALAMARALIDLQSRYRASFHGRGFTKITPAILDRLFKTPILTAPLIRDQMGVSFNTAQKTIDDLERAGILIKVTRQRRNLSWMAREIMDIISGRLVRHGEETG